MSSQGCSVDTALPISFVRRAQERLSTNGDSEDLLFPRTPATDTSLFFDLEGSSPHTRHLAHFEQMFAQQQQQAPQDKGPETLKTNPYSQSPLKENRFLPPQAAQLTSILGLYSGERKINGDQNSFNTALDLLSTLRLSNKARSSPTPNKKPAYDKEKSEIGDDFILLYDDGEKEEEEEEEENVKGPMRRSSSLKSARTNQGGKKIVRFADVLGLDLADVHTFLDEVPRIPKSAFKDLKGVEINSPVGSPATDSFLGRSAASAPRNDKTVVPLFLQPGSQHYFTERLSRNKVCLENAYFTNTFTLSIRGTVRVVNLDFHKAVLIRYSVDKWKTFKDAQTTYVQNSCDGFSDKFVFTINADCLSVGQRLEFAVKYDVLGEEHWDNNENANYAFQCVPEGPPRPVTSAYIPSSIALETWGSFY